MQPTYSTAHPRNECFFQMWRCFESFNSRREITLLHQTWLLAAPTSYYSSYYTLCMRFCHVPQIHCTHTTYFNVTAVKETALSYSTPQSLLSVYVFLHAVLFNILFLFQGTSGGDDSETSSESLPGKSQRKDGGVCLKHCLEVKVFQVPNHSS